MSRTILVCVWERGWNRVSYKFEFFKKLFFLYFWCIDFKNIFKKLKSIVLIYLIA